MVHVLTVKMHATESLCDGGRTEGTVDGSGKSFRGNVGSDGRHSPCGGKGESRLSGEEGTGVTVTAEGKRACFLTAWVWGHWGGPGRDKTGLPVPWAGCEQKGLYVS